MTWKGLLETADDGPPSDTGLPKRAEQIRPIGNESSTRRSDRNRMQQAILCAFTRQLDHFCFDLIAGWCGNFVTARAGQDQQLDQRAGGPAAMSAASHVSLSSVSSNMR
jgi:hypothetical protein